MTVRMIEDIHNYLLEWKGFRSLWKYSKESTCDRFLLSNPSCVGFDEKLLYYYNLRRIVISKTEICQFNAIWLDLKPLKGSILHHIEDWIETLGRLLENTTTNKIEDVSTKISTLSSSLKPLVSLSQLEENIELIYKIEGMSLEVELALNDVQERFRTLDMYGIPSHDMQTKKAAAKLQSKWESLIKQAKQETAKIKKLKFHHQSKIDREAKHFETAIEKALSALNQKGPGTERVSIDMANKMVASNENVFQNLTTKANSIRKKQEVHKLPISTYHHLKILKVAWPMPTKLSTF